MGLLRVLRRLLGAGGDGRRRTDAGPGTGGGGTVDGRGGDPEDGAGEPATADGVAGTDSDAAGGTADGNADRSAPAGGDPVPGDRPAGDDGPDAGDGGGGVEGASADGPAADGATDDGTPATAEDEGAADDGSAGDDAGGDDDPGTAPIAEAVGDDPAAFREQAEEFAAFRAGADLDYTPGSVGRLDQLFEAGREDPEYLRVTLADGRSAAFSPMATAAACYFGETLVRSYGARWVRDADAGWVIEVPGARETARTDVFALAHRGLETGAPFVAAHGELLAGLDLTRVEDDAGDAGPDDTEDVDSDGAEDVRPGDTEGPDAGGTGTGDGDAGDRDPTGGVDSTGGPDPATGADRDPGDGTGVDRLAFLAGVEGDAEAFAEAWPAYELDFSPASLARLDDLVAAEFEGDVGAGAGAGTDAGDHGEDGSPADAGGESGSEGSGASVRPTECGAYLAEVLRRRAGAEWHDGEGGLALSVPGGGTVDPLRVAVRCLRGEGSFAARYRAAVGDDDGRGDGAGDDGPD